MYFQRLVQESFEFRTRLEAKEKAICAQENDFEEYQRQMVKKHSEELQELNENMRKELKNSRKEKESASTELEQVLKNYVSDRSVDW